MPVPASTFLLLSAVLFTMGAIGFMVRRNPLVVFMCIELMLNAVNLAFAAISRYLNSLDGVVFTLGAIGFMLRRNPLVVFMCIELMLNAVNLAFAAISRYLNSLDGVFF